jgi:hypothetical protein
MSEGTGLDEPVRLDKWFWVIYSITLPAFLGVSWRWLWTRPLNEQIGIFLLVPFFLAIVTHTVVRICILCVKREGITRGQVSAVGFALIAIWIYFVVGVCTDMFSMHPFWAPFGGAFVAGITYKILRGVQG